jgi:DnaA family protein
MVSQIPLTLNLCDDNTFSNYYAGENERLLQVLRTTAMGRGEHLIYLYGPSGIGKTHLLQACYHAAHQTQLKAFYLPLKMLNALRPDVLQDLESLNLVCIDDIQAISGYPDWEEAIFCFLNRFYESGKRLVVVGNTQVNHLNIRLLDLVSRLTAGMTFRIQGLSDEEKIAALRLRATRRGFDLPKAVAQFMFRRSNRNMNVLFSTLAKLDQASLENKRRLTIPFVKLVLGI